MTLSLQSFAAVIALLGLLTLPVVAETEAKKPILLVLTNHGSLGETGKPTGFYLSEAAHPWEVFTKAGYPVELATPKGGSAPLDPKSYKLEDPANAAFWKEFGNKDGTAVEKTRSLADVDPTAYAAIFFAGGHGTMWDFPASADVKRVIEGIHKRGGIVAAVCHGPAAFVEAKAEGGSPLVHGKRVAAFTNEEEAAVELEAVVPFLLEDRLKELGAEVVKTDNFTANALRDGRLVTGQNPASATKAAELVVEALNER